MRSVWIIAYIDSTKIEHVVKDLRKKSIYRDIIAYIPTVRILQKKVKNQEIFEYVPLLFNYGFFKIPLPLACNEDFLIGLKQNIQCIFGWVKDSAKTIKSQIEDEGESYNPQVALATERDIANMLLSEEESSIYSAKDLEGLTIGNTITLRGYPFENINAEIISINHNKKQVKVKLELDSILKEVTVSFDNIFYTVYRAHDGDKEMRETSLESLGIRASTGDSRIFAEYLMRNEE